ncbi:PREDICTED: zinc finger ZIC 2 [Prunus dulcis]|uniref:PREDICTED: zinc finger ZIC 2 n=1 Tax=Prunus dulcis TaxID=3755 RepID=A0A5E4F3N1_PRUDU|nr:PREDICTED: zinc finger ZIC 2 [Prunus dulcis]
MKAIATTLVACGSAIGVVICFTCVVFCCRNKNKNKNTVVPPSGQPANRGDVERGGVTNQSSSRTKDGGMDILAGARVALATTAVVIN